MEILDYKISEENIKQATEWAWSIAPRIIAAVIILFVGLWVIKFINRMVRKYFQKADYDLALERFLADLVNWALKIMLIIMVITQLGVQSSSLLAILGAGGLAIGLALQGSLSNFAGGVLILAFKPFRIGDFIEAHGVMGTVKDITIFTTKILTPGNQLAIVPNAKLSNDTIKNYNAEPIRKNMMDVGISYDSDIKLAKDILLNLVTEQELVLKEPAPQVVVTTLGDSAVTLSVRFWAKNEDYWNINFYTVEESKARLEAKGISIPFPQRDIHVFNEK